MSILSQTLADKVELGLVGTTVKHPWLWSWMEQCVIINNMKNVLPNCVWIHGLVGMYPKEHIRKVFMDVIILLLILVVTCFICGMQKLCASRASV